MTVLFTVPDFQRIGTMLEHKRAINKGIRFFAFHDDRAAPADKTGGDRRRQVDVDYHQPGKV